MKAYKKVKLQDISEKIGSGMTPLRTNTEYWNSKDIPWVKTELLGQYIISETSEYISQKAFDENSLTLFPANTLSIAMYGEGKTRGNVSIFGIPMTSNQACCNLIIDEQKADYKYVYYALKSNYDNLRNLASGVRNNLNADLIKNFEISLPDLPTQKKIADVLSCIDDKIALNNKTNTELENMAKTIYDYWFTQFDFPDKNGHPYKTSGGQMVYNEILKREIPAGWKTGCFGDLIEIGNGKDHSKLDDGDFPVYGSGGLMRKVNKSLYSGESVLFPRKGTLNNVMYVNETFWTVDTMFYSIPKKQSLALYVYYNAKHFDFEKMNTGTGVPSMTSSIIKELPIIIPDTSILDSFDKTIQPIYQQVFSNRKENEELTKLRDYLLPLLMNGQIEVR